MPQCARPRPRPRTRGDEPSIRLLQRDGQLDIMLMRALRRPFSTRHGHGLMPMSAIFFTSSSTNFTPTGGTPGTEVAYLLRVLLGPSRAPPQHDQLRIIASSASLSGRCRRARLLHGFFGRDRSRFRIIPGDQRPIDAGAAADIRAYAERFIRLGQDFQDSLPLAAAADRFSAAVGAPAG